MTITIRTLLVFICCFLAGTLKCEPANATDVPESETIDAFRVAHRDDCRTGLLTPLVAAFDALWKEYRVEIYVEEEKKTLSLGREAPPGISRQLVQTCLERYERTLQQSLSQDWASCLERVATAVERDKYLALIPESLGGSLRMAKETDSFDRDAVIREIYTRFALASPFQVAEIEKQTTRKGREKWTAVLVPLQAVAAPAIKKVPREVSPRPGGEGPPLDIKTTPRAVRLFMLEVTWPHFIGLLLAQVLASFLMALIIVTLMTRKSRQRDPDSWKDSEARVELQKTIAEAIQSVSTEITTLNTTLSDLLLSMVTGWPMSKRTPCGWTPRVASDR